MASGCHEAPPPALPCVILPYNSQINSSGKYKVWRNIIRVEGDAPRAGAPYTDAAPAIAAAMTALGASAVASRWEAAPDEGTLRSPCRCSPGGGGGGAWAQPKEKGRAGEPTRPSGDAAVQAGQPLL